MRTEHLTEEEVQQYALDAADSGSTQPPAPISGSTEATAHLESCAQCQARVADYRWLFAGIRQQPRPSFEGNLAAMVVAQLPPPKLRFSWSAFFVTLLIIDGAGGIAIGCYLFRADLAALFAGFSYAFGYLIAVAVTTVILFQSLDMYIKHQKKMRSLDF
jgi:hypothetical protein